MTLNKDQRKIYSTALIELANISLAALVFGQWLSENSVNIPMVIIGFNIFIFSYFFVYHLSK